MTEIFYDYDKPDGKWGWFHNYNPTNKTFAEKCVYNNGGITIDNGVLWYYQKSALESIFGSSYVDIKEEKLLEKINDKISKLYNFVITEEKLKGIGVTESAHFLAKLDTLVSDYKIIGYREQTKEEIAGLFILLALDVMIRDCEYRFIENIISVAYKFQRAVEVIGAHTTAESYNGRKKGMNKRLQVLNDYKSMGDAFWGQETKYEGRICWLEEYYGVGETTAKKFYKLIKEYEKNCRIQYKSVL